MENSIKSWLQDIKDAIEEVYSFLPEKRDFDSFERDLKSKRAIERNIEIIGEALNRILQAEPDIDISESRKIVDTRDRIIHGYDTVSSAVIWSIITRDLPILENEIKELLT